MTNCRCPAEYNARIDCLFAGYRWQLLDLPRVLAGVARELAREATR